MAAAKLNFCITKSMKISGGKQLFLDFSQNDHQKTKICQLSKMTAGAEDIQDWIDKANAPRVSNRAKAHMVTMEELSQFYPELQGADFNAWRHRFGTGPGGEGTEVETLPNGDIAYNRNLLNNSLTILRRYADLRKGDVIFLEFDIGYRNDGKVMFNGQELVDLAWDPDEYGNVPEEFQIGEFPPLYWSEVIVHNNYIPFNVSRNLPKLTLANVRYFPRTDGRGFHLTLPFQVANGHIYVIMYTQIIPQNGDLASVANQFLSLLRDEHYFRYNSDNYEEIRWPNPPETSEEDMLLIGPTAEDQDLL